MVTWSTLAQVVACWLIVPIHYLNQCWLLIIEVMWHSSHSKFAANTQAATLYQEKYILLILHSHFLGANELIIVSLPDQGGNWERCVVTEKVPARYRSLKIRWKFGLRGRPLIIGCRPSSRTDNIGSGRWFGRWFPIYSNDINGLVTPR